MIHKTKTSSRLNYFLHSGQRNITLSISAYQVELLDRTHRYEHINGVYMGFIDDSPIIFNEEAVRVWESIISIGDELAKESIEAAKAVLSKPLL